MDNLEGIKDKFIVIKRTDANKYLVPVRQMQLQKALEMINCNREAEGKSLNTYLVVNTDDYKIDDEFFINIQKETYICKISGFFIDKDETRFLVAFQDEDDKTWFEIGETHKKEELFLTKEEAEKELERLKGAEVDG